MWAMMLEFPEDPLCWTLTDQYMFGDKLLVAPIIEAGQTEREVYLPSGLWQDFYSDRVYEGGQTVNVPAPIDVIPVFRKMGFQQLTKRIENVLYS